MPNRKGGGVHAYARRQFNSTNLANIALPDKIKCDVCQKHKHRDNYSTKQLDDARYKIFEYGPNSKFKLKCRACTGQGLVELQCRLCHKWKGLDFFSKAKRRNPDNAICMDCMDQDLAADAPGEEKYEPEYDHWDSDEDPCLSEIGTLSTASVNEGTVPTRFGKCLDESSTSDASSLVETYRTYGSEDGGVLLSGYQYHSKDYRRPWKDSSTATSVSSELYKTETDSAKLSTWGSKEKPEADTSSLSGGSQVTLNDVITERRVEASKFASQSRFPRVRPYKEPQPAPEEEYENEYGELSDDDEWDAKHGDEEESGSDDSDGETNIIVS